MSLTNLNYQEEAPPAMEATKKFDALQEVKGGG